jgi:RNA-directed DNA polymerase
LIITEGKTDWKHIKAAFLRFKAAGYIKFDIDFHEFNESRGDSDTLDMCKKQARLDNVQTRIFLFDRDVPSIVNEVSGKSAIYKDWGKNVFSFPLPLPEHRTETPEISIEFYYQNDDLTRRDKHNRRLFLNNEFSSASGRHRTDDINCLDLNKLKSPILKIIDDKVFNSNNENIALSKDGFADKVYTGIENFDSLDIFAFSRIFKVIAEIMKYPEDLISIPVSLKVNEITRKPSKNN